MKYQIGDIIKVVTEWDGVKYFYVVGNSKKLSDYYLLFDIQTLETKHYSLTENEEMSVVKIGEDSKDGNYLDESIPFPNYQILYRQSDWNGYEVGYQDIKILGLYSYNGYDYYIDTVTFEIVEISRDTEEL